MKLAHPVLRACCLLALGVALLLSAATPVAALTPTPAAGQPPGPAPTAATLDPEGVSATATPAYGGVYRAGNWLPIVVELRNEGPDRQVEVRAAAGGSTAYAARVDLPNGAVKSVTLYTHFQGSISRLSLQVLSDGRELIRQPVRLQPLVAEARLLGVAGAAAAPLRVIDRTAGTSPIAAVTFDLAAMPDRREGLSPFTALVLDGGVAGTLAPAQLAALTEWILAGGQLIVGGGVSAADSLALLPEALRPVTLEGVERAPASAIYGADADAGEISVARFRPVEPASGPAPYARPVGALRPADGRPLVLEQTYGRGAVTFVGAPLSGPSFERWPGQAAFWRDLTDQGETIAPGMGPGAGTADSLIEGNLAVALTSIPALEFPSLSLLGTLLLAYILLVGPGTYLLLRSRDRQALGWVVIPALTAIFAAAAYGFGYSQRGGDIIFNEINYIEVLDGPDSQVARARSLVGVFSPALQPYTLDVATDAGADPLLRPISVQGPWDTGASMQSGLFMQDMGDGRAQATNLEIPKWSMRALMTEDLRPAPGLEARIVLEGTKMRAEVFNGGERALEDVAVTHAGYVARLGDLGPGERRSAEMVRPGGQMMQGTPMSFLIYGSDIEEHNRLNRGPLPVDLQLRTRILDAIFAYGPVPRTGQPMLVAWGDQAPISISTPNGRSERLSTELITLEPRLELRGEADLEQGWLGQTVNAGPESVCYGPVGVGINLLDRPLTVDLSLPRDLYGLRPSALTLITSADGQWPADVRIEAFSWDAGEWLLLPEDARKLQLSDPERFLGSHGRVRLRLSRDANQAFNPSGCIYADATVKGALP